MEMSRMHQHCRDTGWERDRLLELGPGSLRSLPAPAPQPGPPLRIGVIAPPWVAVPPPSYGGTELILDVLCRGLAARGNDVVLFTTGDSTCEVPRAWLFPEAMTDRMGSGLIELRHVSAAYDTFAGFDVVHDHTVLGLCTHPQRDHPAVVTTNHGPFDEHLVDLYRRVAPSTPLIAISHDQASRAPADIPVATVIHHGLDLERYRFDPRGGDYLLFLGRMNPDKGIETAIEIARRCGTDLAIAAKMREPAEREYFTTVIEPLLGDGVEYIGEVGHDDKVALLCGARALLNPICWPEPFGLVMAEALACGTPVVGTPQGAAPEIVGDAVTGYLADTVAGLVDGVAAAGDLDRRACRAAVEERFSMDRMARDHERFYRSVLHPSHPLVPLSATRRMGSGRSVIAS
jgi:glycosyltransferase involved in cell wall biosynthesis